VAAPRVSIVVTTYNFERFIGACLRSVLALEGGEDMEVIVVDDASTDASEQVIRGITDPRLRYIRHAANQGAAATVNHAFAEARGEFIARIDGDDRYRPGFLRKAMQALEANPRAGLVCGRIHMLGPQDEDFGASALSVPAPSSGDYFAALLAENFISAPTVLGRREAWEAALPVPDGMNFCDWYMALCVAELWQVAVVDEVLADYRVHPQQMHATMIGDRSGERTTWRVLDHFFERSPRAAEIAPRRGAIYARHWAQWADRYFGLGLHGEARRCYLQAIGARPGLAFDAGIARWLAATYLGAQRYERLKAWLR
jgi:glycosyltransferase involved in cell wall biosynthesis